MRSCGLPRTQRFCGAAGASCGGGAAAPAASGAGGPPAAVGAPAQPILPQPGAPLASPSVIADEDLAGAGGSMPKQAPAAAAAVAGPASASQVRRSAAAARITFGCWARASAEPASSRQSPPCILVHACSCMLVAVALLMCSAFAPSQLYNQLVDRRATFAQARMLHLLSQLYREGSREDRRCSASRMGGKAAATAHDSRQLDKKAWQPRLGGRLVVKHWYWNEKGEKTVA